MSKSVTIISPTTQDPAIQEEVWMDGPTHALLVKVVNPGGGGGGAGTEYAEDSPHTTGDFGTLALVVRKDTPGTLAGTDGDYAVLQVDATGRLRVAVDAFTGTVPVTQSTTPWVVGDGGGSLTVDGTVAISGTVAVTQSTSPWVVSGTVAATQSGTWNVNVLDVIPGIGTANLGKQINQLATAADVGVALLTVDIVGGTYLPISSVSGAVVINDGSGSITVDGMVTINQIVPGTGATQLGKAEDDVHASGDVGVMALGVRADTAAATAANGDYTPFLTDSLGRVHVNVGKVTPGTGITDLGKAVGGAYAFSGDVGVMMLTLDSGTLTWQPLLSSGNAVFVNVQGVTPGTANVNLGKAEDAAHASGDVGVMSLAVRNDAGTALAGTTGDYIPLTTNSQGKLWTVATQAGQWIISSGDGSGIALGVYEERATVPALADGLSSMFSCITPGGVLPTNGTWSPGYISDSTGGILVDVQNAIAVSAVVPGTGATNLGKAEDATHTSGDVGVMALAVRQDTLASSTSATGDYAALKVDSLGALYVNMGNPTSLANGQLAATKGTLLTSSGYSSVSSVDLFNTSTTTTETVKIYLKESGGTSRQVRQYTLGPKESVNVLDGDTWNLENGDLIEGETTNATTVDFFITGLVR